MAATNFTPIILYHTTTASATPSAGNLNNGELAINITDGKLFYKDNGGTVQVIATKGTGTIGGSNTQVQYNSSGALAGSANFTFNGTTATINTLNLTNALGTTFGGTGLNAYTTGDLVYASGTNTLAKLGIGLNTYILTSTGSVPQWSAPSAVTVATATNLAGGAAGSVPYQSGASTTTFLSIGSAGQVLTSSGTAPQWSNLSSLGVTSLSFGTTGLTPSTATQGAITVAGTLATTNGGTGLTSFTANGVVYASSSSALATGSALTFDGTNLGVPAEVYRTTASSYLRLSGGNGAGNGANIIAFGQSHATNPNRLAFSAPSATATSYIDFSTAGAEALRITAASLYTASGINVGIGESTLYNKLTVTGNNPVVTINNNKNSAAGDIARLTLNPSGSFYNGSFYDKGPSVDGLLENVLTVTSALRFSVYNGNNNIEGGRFSSDGTFRVKGAGTAGSTDAVQFAGTAPASSLALNSSGNLLLGTTSATGAKMDLAFSTTQSGLAIVPTSYVYPTYSLLTTNGVIGTVKSGSGTVRLLDIRAQEQTALANGQVIGGYFQIDNPNAAVNVNGGNIGLYGVVNGVNNFTTGHQYGVLGRAGSGGTWGVGVMAQLGAEQTLGLRAALVAQTDNTTDPIALFRNSGGEVGRFTGNGNFGVGATPSTWLWPDGSTGVLQLQAGAAFSGYNAGAVVSQNWYYNAGEKFIANGYASRYSQTTGLHIWSTSTASNAGGAGAALTWAEVARMDNDKNLLIGTTSSAGRLAVVGGATSTGYNLYLGQGGSYQDTAGYGNSDYGNGTWNWVPGTVPGSGAAQFYTRFRSRSGPGYSTTHNVMIDGGVLVADTTTAYSAQLYVNGAIAARNGGVDGTFQNAFVAGYTSNYTEKNIIQTAVSSGAGGSGFRFQVSNGGGSSGVTNALDVLRSVINFYSGGSIVANIQSQGLYMSGANWIYWDKSGTRSWQMYCNQTNANMILSSGDGLGTIQLVSSAVQVSGSLSKGSGSFRIEHPLPELAPTHQLVHSFIEGPQADLIYRGKVNLVNGTATINIDQAAGMTEGTFVVLCRDVQCFTTNESDWTAVRGSVSGNILTIEAQDNTSTASISWMVIGERQDKHMYDTEWTDDNGKVIVEPLKPQ